MLNNLIKKFKIIVSDPDLRNKIIFTLFILALFRVGASIPIPGVDKLRLAEFFSGNQLFGLLNVFSGGGLANLSIMMLGVGPYITATIIMQLLTMIFPKLKELYHEEGEAGRKKFNQYARLATIPLAILQGFALLALLSRQGVMLDITLFGQIVNVVIVTAGSVLLMWLGELVSEHGIGNGVSILIFAGIVAGIPSMAGQLLFTFTAAQVPIYLIVAIIAVLVVAGVVLVTEAERPIPVSYAKRVRGNKIYGGVSTYIPLRVNQAGVIPIIFALSLLLFPQMLAGALSKMGSEIIQTISGIMLFFVTNPWVSSIFYFILVFAFTYFYTAVTFDPEAISTNLQKSGAFVPGIRPGRSTASHINKILTRITFVGALFLGFIAVLPMIMRSVTGIAAFAIGGTALLIVVSVVLEMVKKVEAQVSMRDYE